MTETYTEKIQLKCKICGAHARYIHFGVLSCESCKMFFKRNAGNKQSTFICDLDGQCEININNHRMCTSCRLAKCFQTGMDIQLFRSSHSTRKTKKSVSLPTNQMKIVNQQMLPTLNLLRTDLSTLTEDQWILLSNLVHSYDERKMSSVCQRIIQEDENSYAMKPLNETLIKEFFRLFHETIESCLRSNDDLRNLSSNDRSTLLRIGADCITCAGGAFTMYQTQLYTCRSFLDTICQIYGDYSVALTLHSLKFADSDLTLVKMAPLLLLFSNNTCIFSSPIPLDYVNMSIILQIQNKYAEVLWKYLLYRYGYSEAIQKFMRFTQFLLALIQTLAQLQTVRLHLNNIESIAENTELTLVLDDID